MGDVVGSTASRTVISDALSSSAKGLITGDLGGIGADFAGSVLGDSAYNSAMSGIGGRAIGLLGGATTGGVLLAVTDVTPANGPEAALESYSADMAKNDITNLDGRPMTINEAEELAQLRYYK